MKMIIVQAILIIWYWIFPHIESALSRILLKELETFAISKKEHYEKDMKEISGAAVVSNIGENDFFDTVFLFNDSTRHW